MSTTPSTPISPKVIVAGVVALLVPATLSILGYLQTAPGQTLLGSLPPPVAVLLTAIIPAVAVFLSSYAKSDPLRYHPAVEPAQPPADVPPEPEEVDRTP